MWKVTFIVGILCVAAVVSDFCKTTTGYWSSGVTDGANDFAHTGVALNDSYYCFEGCLNTAMVNQKYKVKLANPPSIVSRRRLSWEDRVEQFGHRATNPGMPLPTKKDPNADGCMDPVLRQDIGDALQKVTNHSAAAIARTIQYQINRPGWCINVVEMKGGLSIDDLFHDMNFCLYSAYMNPEFYDIRLAAIDFSS